MYTVYVLKCGDGTFYTGITTDVKRRLEEHRNGIGAKYTRGRTPIRLMRTEKYRTRSTAQKREAHIKSLSRKEKVQLIKGA